MKKLMTTVLMLAVLLSGCAGGEHDPSAGSAPEDPAAQTTITLPHPLAPSEPLSVTVTEETPETAVHETPAQQAPPEYISEVSPPPAAAQTTPAAEEPPLPAFTIETETDETVWATAAVNVRTGPSTNHERVGGLWFGDSVTRTGLTSNGWSRITFDGVTAYVISDYLTTSNPDPNAGVGESTTPFADEPPAAETPETPAVPETPDTPAPPPPPLFTITTLSENVSYDQIYSTLYTLCKEIGSRRVGLDGNNKAKDYIYNSLTALGFSEADGSLWTHGFYSTGNLYTENVNCSIPSATGSNRIVVVSTHYDSVRDVEGAIDNASGVAALLEACRVIKESGEKFDFELRFSFFSAEEDGYKGAYEYIRRQGPNIGRHICNFNIDMAGYAISSAPKALVVSTKGDPSTSNWNPAQPNIMSGSIVTAYYALGLDFERYYSPTNAGKHDSVAFWDNDVPTATLSWREIDASRAYGNDLGVAAPAYIHSVYDCLENLNVDSVVTTTGLIVTAICALGEEVAKG